MSMHPVSKPAQGAVLVVLVNWRRAADTIACINSLMASQHPHITIAVCDNASPDGSYQALAAAMAQLPFTAEGAGSATEQRFVASQRPGCQVLLTLSPRNLGFAGGNNFAHQRAMTVYGDVFSHVWFLNNDTEQQADCLPQMLRKFQAPGRQVGMVGSTMVYDFDRKTVQALGGSVYKPLTGLMQEIGNGQSWPCPADEAAIEAQMSYVCGASMLVSRELIQAVGLMTEDYFLFFEEIDWAQRARRAGYALGYASAAVVFHKEGAAIGTGKGATRSLLAEYFGLRNKLLITWRFFPWAFPSVWLVSCMQAARRVVQGRPANAGLMARVLLGMGRPPLS